MGKRGEKGKSNRGQCGMVKMGHPGGAQDSWQGRNEEIKWGEEMVEFQGVPEKQGRGRIAHRDLARKRQFTVKRCSALVPTSATNT